MTLKSTMSDLASTAVEAVLMGALVDDSHVTVDAGVARWAAATVRALAGVEAGGSILAGLVRGAVVQILLELGIEYQDATKIGRTF